MKITIEEQREKEERKTEQIIFNSKKEFVKGSFIYDVRTIHKHPILV